ncbi:serine hydrolase domain-containing protein [Candidatus Palauibacter sp.]|uniref:serine hydrolase domain-containing protein n=1 Tax=Candidatus Palauibacter sp. TaxID=3101350 RepID=UPI003B010648
MKHEKRVQCLVALAALVLALGAGFACSPAPVDSPESVYPGASWERIADPSSAGFSTEALDEIHPYVEGISTSAVMAVVGGRVLFEHGPVDSLSYLASVRKSILAMLYGNYVEDGTIDLELTLEDLGMDDVQGLLPIEKRARVLDLVTARSGVYHPASNAGDNLADAPPRGSQEPGTYYLYSNWDFNASGAVFEQLTGRNIYDALETDLALPIGFEDWDRSIHRKSGDASRSRNLAYHMTLSTRDMARIGHLMLRGGVWEDERVLPQGWAERITSVVTPSEEMNPEGLRGGQFGYGYMWWVWDGPAVPEGFEGAYSGRGAYGQFITVIPSLGMVVAHKTVPDARTPWNDYMGILTRLVAAHCGTDC